MDETLKIRIKAITSDAQKKIDSLKSSLGGIDKSTSSVTEGMGGLSKGLAGVGVALVALKATISAVQGAISVAKIGDEIKDEAQKVHMGTTAYQEWGYVMKQNGVELGTLKTAMRQFSNTMASNRAVLQKYGVTADNVEEGFRQAIANIQNMSSETEKVAAMTELFGSRASELMPVLNMTNGETETLINDYHQLGGVMSNELIAMSDRLSDDILRMKTAWSGLGYTLSQAIIPVINAVVNWITNLIVKVNNLFSSLLRLKKTFGGEATAEVNDYATAIGGVGGAVKGLTKTIFGFDQINRLNGNSGSGGGGGLASAIFGTTGYIEDLASQYDQTADSIGKATEKNNQFLKDLKDKGLWQTIKDNVTTAMDGADLSIKGLWNSLKDYVTGATTDLTGAIIGINTSLDAAERRAKLLGSGGWDQKTPTVEIVVKGGQDIIENVNTNMMTSSIRNNKNVLMAK